MAKVFELGSLWDNFVEDTFFPEPLDQKFSAFEKLVQYYVANKMAALGGIITFDTTKKQFGRILKGLTSVVVEWMQYTAVKNSIVRTRLVANCITLQQDGADPSAAMVFWSAHPLPGSGTWKSVPQAQSAWDKLTDNDRERVVFFQNLARDALMHYSTLYLSKQFIMLLRRELSIARRLEFLSLELRVDSTADPPDNKYTRIQFLAFYGAVDGAAHWEAAEVVPRDHAADQEACRKISISWTKFVSIITSKLSDPSARTLIETVVTLRRTADCSMIMWTRTLIQTRDLCIAKGVLLPALYGIRTSTPSSRRRRRRSRFRPPRRTTKPPISTSPCTSRLSTSSTRIKFRCSWSAWSLPRRRSSCLRPVASQPL